jgi:hypothetical protein
MELVRLSNKETEEVEYIARPLETFVYSDWVEEYKKFLHWYGNFALRAKPNINEINQSMSEMLGAPPNYYRNYEFRYALWGFSWRLENVNPNNKLIITSSKKGVNINMHPKFRLNMIGDFLMELNNMVGVESA